MIQIKATCKNVQKNLSIIICDTCKHTCLIQELFPPMFGPVIIIALILELCKNSTDSSLQLHTNINMHINQNMNEQLRTFILVSFATYCSPSASSRLMIGCRPPSISTTASSTNEGLVNGCLMFQLLLVIFAITIMHTLYLLIVMSKYI